MPDSSAPIRSSPLRRLLVVAVSALCLGGLAAAWIGSRTLMAPVYPGTQWTWKSPGQGGFSAEKLAAFSEKAGGTGCIVQAGKMIHSWGDIARRMDVASAAKPIYAYLIFKAIETGRLGSLDDPVERWVPEIAELNPGLGHKDRAITFRHLLSQTSGYGLLEQPGEAFAYNDFATGLLVWTLMHRVYGLPPKRYNKLLQGPLLGEAIGFEDQPTMTHPDAIPGRLRISARDMARFALLYSRKGEWAGKRLLQEDLFRSAMSAPLPPTFPRTEGEEADTIGGVASIGGGKDAKHHAGSLGYFWWFNHVTPDGTPLLSDASPRTILGSGSGGLFAMVVLPEYEVVAVWFLRDKYPLLNWSPFDQVGRHRVNSLIQDLLEARTAWPPSLAWKLATARELRTWLCSQWRWKKGGATVCGEEGWWRTGMTTPADGP